MINVLIIKNNTYNQHENSEKLSVVDKYFYYITHISMSKISHTGKFSIISVKGLRSETVVRRCSSKLVLLKNSFFLIKLQV